jgi:hypothetical protein
LIRQRKIYLPTEGIVNPTIRELLRDFLIWIIAKAENEKVEENLLRRLKLKYTPDDLIVALMIKDLGLRLFLGRSGY